MNEAKRIYHSYLLRLWSVKEDNILVWRASLEEASTGEKKAFKNLDELCQYLKSKTAVSGKKESSK